MRTYRQGAFTRFTFTADETYAWARKPGAYWPCSALAGHRLSITVDGADLTCDIIDLRIDGRDIFNGDDSLDLPEHEISAFLADHA